MTFNLDINTVIIVVAVLLLVFLLFMAMKKGWFKPSPRDLELVAGDGAVLYVNGDQIDYDYYKRIAQNLYEGLSVSNYTDSAMMDADQVIRSLTDNELRLVSNAYEKKYRGKSENTIKNLVNGEWLLCTALYNSPACEAREYINSRLNSIGV